MPLSTEQAVRETFRIALEENLRKNLRTQEEFDRFRAIADEAGHRIDAENDAFRANYHRRLEVAREVVLREHNARTLDYPKPDWAVDTPPGTDKIDLLARNRVQADHEARILAIRIDQADQYQALSETCRARENTPESVCEQRHRQAQKAFNLTNRTSLHERGVPMRSGPTQS